jgi:hypothetical protein
MLLGFVVSERGIEANTEKISAIMDMGPIKNLKGVQRVTGFLAALSRFIARLGERSPPLYKLMKKSDCRMDLPGPTTSVGTRTDYSVGPWNHPTCDARYLLA